MPCADSGRCLWSFTSRAAAAPCSSLAATSAWAVGASPHSIEVVPPADGGRAIGLIEGWRGPVLLALEAGPAGTIRRCHPHDPSWQNWPVLEHAVIGNIVPDFPLINKSFNLSYSGHDL